VTITLAQLTRASFEPLLHQRFALRAGDHALELELAEVKSLGSAPRPTMREPFSLLFHGPHTPAFRQGTYSLQHEALGTQSLFLVPVGRDAQHTCYQAIFT
jgi:hypothetical protein